jgi:hypothetical protein
MEQQPTVDLAGTGEARTRTDTNEQTAAPDGAEPIAGYLALAFTFLGLTCAGLVWLRRNKLLLPKPNALDVALIGLGTARLSRLITREKVARPLRAPFTITERTERAEVKEHAKGSGMIRAAGELVTCPRCTAIWAAGGLCLVYFASPSAGRFFSLILSSSLISDFANRKFAILNEANPSAAARG